ncbi:MAG: ribosome maturation factor RimM [Rubrivivax sp.]|nr:ribosome maturation factor RimM [Rubrivivax sp.]
MSQPAPTEAPVTLPEDAVEVGRVVGAWGVKGGLRIKPFAADPQALFSSKRWYLAAPDIARPVPPAAGKTAAAAPVWPRLLRIVQAREQGDAVVATAQDLDDRDAAQALAGARVLISRGSFPTPDPGEFYWVDLIGLAVSNREQAELGRVVGLIETGPHCVLRIQPPQAGAPERLIPFVDAYVDSVDLAGRRIVVDWDAED